MPQLLPDFFALWPERFSNKTNGVTHRRWLAGGNPELAALIDESIGPAWLEDLDRLRDLEPCAEDASFRERFLAIKTRNKERLAGTVLRETRVTIDPREALFDVQAKRIHEYKAPVAHGVGRRPRLPRARARRTDADRPAQLPLRGQGGARLLGR